MDYYQPKEFEERIIETKRVSKKTKGGSSLGFSALVVVGNKNGKVGYGLGKAKDISVAIQKAIKVARNGLVDVNISGFTIAHDVEAKFKSSRLKLMPAPEGSGIIAGGSVRHIVELVGIKNISAKLLGASNNVCNAQCAIDALKKLKA